MVTFDDSHGIVSLNRNNFNFYTYSSYILVEFLANEVFTGICSNLVKGTQISIYLISLKCIPSILYTNIL
jgi:hypothetical protein